MRLLLRSKFTQCTLQTVSKLFTLTVCTCISYTSTCTVCVKNTFPLQFLKTEQNRTKWNGMVGCVQSTAQEKSCVWSFHGMPMHAFKSKPLVMSHYWYALESMCGHSHESSIHGIIRERLITRALRYRFISFVENGKERNGTGNFF